jgi:flavin prenyltransferase
MSLRRIIVCISGASGAAYAVDICRAIGACADIEPHLLVTPTGSDILRDECGVDSPAQMPNAEIFGPGAGRAVCHDIRDLHAPIASGSYPVEAMAVVPCSMGRIGAFASGIVRDLMDRAAEVTLKEKRPLILAPRETPLSLIHLENLSRLARAGATIMPASPGFYHSSAAKPATAEDLVRFMTARIMDHLKLPCEGPRWMEHSAD